MEFSCEYYSSFPQSLICPDCAFSGVSRSLPILFAPCSSSCLIHSHQELNSRLVSFRSCRLGFVPTPFSYTSPFPCFLPFFWTTVPFRGPSGYPTRNRGLFFPSGPPPSPLFPFFFLFLAPLLTYSAPYPSPVRVTPFTDFFLPLFLLFVRRLACATLILFSYCL